MNKPRSIFGNYFIVSLLLFFSLFSAGGLFSESLKKLPDLAAENLKGKVKKYITARYESENGRFKIQDKKIKVYSPDGLILEEEHYRGSNLMDVYKHKYDWANRMEFIDNNAVYINSVFEIRNTYDKNGNIKVSQSGGTIVEYFYDTNDNETRCLTYRNNELIEVIGKKYDAAGHILEEIVTNGKDVSRKEEFIYNEKGFLQTKTEYNLNKSKIYNDYRYDNSGNLILEVINVFHPGSPVPDSTVTNSYRFDEKGNEVETIFSYVRIVKRYDKDNRLVQKITYSREDPDRPDFAYKNEVYRYDKEGNIIKIMKYFLPAGGTELKLNEITEFTIEYY